MDVRKLGVATLVLLYIAIPQRSASAEASKDPKSRTPIASQATTTPQTLAPNSDSGAAIRDPQSVISESPVVKVLINSSRPEVASNGAYGIFADLENVTSVPITLYPADTEMVTQPEVAGDDDCVFSADGFYPTEPAKSDQLPKGGPIVIQPKEHYAVFWDISKSNTRDCFAGPELVASKSQKVRASWFKQFRTGLGEQLSFVPGDYVFVVVGKAHYMREGVEEPNYHTYTDKVKIHVGLSQIDTMTAAMFGGIVGYLVMALRDSGDLGKLRKQTLGSWSARFIHGLVIARSLFSAALVSSVVTVILSRISDTQFPIKVSVNDFWGALTVGFVAYFVGNKLIDRIVGLASSNKANSGEAQN